jgi:hypothetical protein
MPRTLLTLIVIALALQACETTEEPPAVRDDDGAAREPPLNIRVITDARVAPGDASEARRQLIADILFEGLQALDADRLLTPIDDNAHARFMRVLAYEPDNKIALDGLQEIVVRYLALSEESARRGFFDEAQLLLDRARFVDADHPDIAATGLALQAEMNSGDLFFTLDEREFSRRSEAAESTLADIATQARDHGALFLITAPNDDLARWMFSIMRSAVEGYRLRGNIELASRTSIRLRLPTE